MMAGIMRARHPNRLPTIPPPRKREGNLAATFPCPPPPCGGPKDGRDKWLAPVRLGTGVNFNPASHSFRALFILLAILFACLQAAYAQSTLPALTGRVVDNAGLIDPAAEAALTRKLEEQLHDLFKRVVPPSLVAPEFVKTAAEEAEKIDHAVFDLKAKIEEFLYRGMDALPEPKIPSEYVQVAADESRRIAELTTLLDERGVLQARVDGTLVMALPFAGEAWTLLLAVPCILLSYRRTAWGGLALAVAALAWLAGRRWRWPLLLGVLPALLLVLGWVGAQRIGAQTRLGGASAWLFDLMGSRFGAESARVLELQLAWQSFTDSPWVGLGAWGRYAYSHLIPWQTSVTAGNFLHSGVLHLAHLHLLLPPVAVALFLLWRGGMAASLSGIRAALRAQVSDDELARARRAGRRFPLGGAPRRPRGDLVARGRGARAIRWRARIRGFAGVGRAGRPRPPRPPGRAGSGGRARRRSARARRRRRGRAGC